LNCVNSVLGSVRRRGGTELLERLDFAREEYHTGALSSGIGLDGNVQEYGNSSTSAPVGENTLLFSVDYGGLKDGLGIRLNKLSLGFRAPVVSFESVREWTRVYDGQGLASSSQYAWVERLLSLSVDDPGAGVGAADSFGVLPPEGRWTVPAGEEVFWGSAIGPYSISFQLLLGAVSSASLSASGGFRGSDLSAANEPGSVEQFHISSDRLPFVRNSPPRQMQAGLYSSADGSEWVQEGVFTITESLQSFQLALSNPARFVKLEVLPGQGSVDAPLDFGYIQAYTVLREDISKVKAFPYYYNIDQRYLFILSNFKVSIYKVAAAGISLLQELSAPEMSEDYLDELKIDYNYDTIVLCHADMPTKRIRRLPGDVFEFSNFEFKNMIMHDFHDALSPPVPGGVFNFQADAKDGIVNLSAGSWNASQAAQMTGQILTNGLTSLRLVEVSAGAAKAYTINGFPAFEDYEGNRLTQSGFYIEGSQEPIFSAARGWPRACCFAMARLAFGGTPYLPAHIVVSRAQQYDNFKRVSASDDSGAFDYPLDTAERIVNMKAARGLHIFTTGNEQTVGENSMTLASFKAVISSDNGSSPLVNPVSVNGMIVFADRGGRSLMSYTYDYEAGGYVSGNLSQYNDIIKDPVSLSVAANSNVDRSDYIYAVMSDGSMSAICIVPAQNTNAANLWTTDGRFKQVVCMYDDVFLLVERGGYVNVERLTQANRLDCQRDGLSTVGGKLYDLGDYEGLKIAVYKDGWKVGEFTVADGVADLGADYDGLRVGLPFKSRLRLNDIAVNGETKSRIKCVNRAQIVTKNTTELQFCGDKLRSDEDFYDFVRCVPYGREAICWAESDYEPFEIKSILLYIGAGDLR
jgi:hypothetical protein